MVNEWTGEYKYDPNEPEKTRCDLDRICDLITKTFGYTPTNISIEELAMRILADMMEDDTYSIYKDNAIDTMAAESWLYDNQPLSDFDYKA